MIEIRKLNKAFRKKTVIDGLQLELVPGTYGLLGPNGAGKTTLIRCMTNLYRYDGEIFWQGQNIRGNDGYMQKLGYLPQQFGAYRELTATENLAYFCELKGIRKQQQKGEIEKVLEAVNLTDAGDKKAKNLSGGMLRRLGIAQTLLGDPDVMIFDEPTAGLDPEERLRFKMIVSALPKDKVILISTHIVEDVDALCGRIVILKQGRLLFNGDTKDLKEKASGKTYECPEDTLCRIKGRHLLERRFEQGEQVMYRLVAEETQDIAAVTPKIEDGYICVLEGI